MVTAEEIVAPKKKESRKDRARPELAEAEMKRYGKMEGDRKAVFDSAWQTLSQYFLPNMSDIDTEKTEGTEGWSDRIFDTTAIEDARTCTTGQMNWATPATEPWWQWGAPRALNMDDDDEGALWYGRCTEIAQDELARSNYYRISGEQYKARTIFGTGPMFMDYGKTNVINCRTFKPGTYCIVNDDEDMADTLYRKFELTARQAGQMFDYKELGEKVRKCLRSDGGKEMDKKFTFLHVIRPREEVEREDGKMDPENKPVASIYICFEDKCCVRVSGYDEIPFSVTRFDSWGTGTPWGYSPAFETLPNVRQLNYIVRFMDAQYELKANPRILEPAALAGQVDLRPGGRTTFDPNLGKDFLPREWMTSADITGTERAVMLKQEAVHRMFYVDVFKALQQIKYKATAYEISQRLGENLQQLSPMFMRLISEKTGPDLKRIFGLMFRANKFPPPPKSLLIPVPGSKNKARLAMPEITYTSRLALALKSMQNRASVDVMQFVNEFIQGTGRAELLDNWDLDALFRGYALNQGMSARYERPMKRVIEIRTQRNRQQAQERTLALTEKAASAAGKLGKAPQGIQDAISEQMSAA